MNVSVGTGLTIILPVGCSTTKLLGCGWKEPRGPWLDEEEGKMLGNCGACVGTNGGTETKGGLVG